jgi:hypothetical protein
MQYSMPPPTVHALPIGVHCSVTVGGGGGGGGVPLLPLLLAPLLPLLLPELPLLLAPELPELLELLV